MRSAAILGSGFGLYGYLPALLDQGCSHILLPQRYRPRFEQRPELETFSPLVEWCEDESVAIRSTSCVVLALMPDMQSQWLRNCLKEPNIDCLLLEKPLAATPQEARWVHSALVDSGKQFGVAYLFRYLSWAEQLSEYLARSSIARLRIRWKFLAHHFRNNVMNWKRVHEQGGGVIRFYGIHLIALLAEFGFSTVNYSESYRVGGDEHAVWNAELSSAKLPVCEIEVDSTCARDEFSIEGIGVSGENYNFRASDPFNVVQLTASQDRRVGIIAQYCRSTWDGSGPTLGTYSNVIELWNRVEHATVIAPYPVGHVECCDQT